jgi:hypothetical protein
MTNRPRSTLETALRVEGIFWEWLTIRVRCVGTRPQAEALRLIVNRAYSSLVNMIRTGGISRGIHAAKLALYISRQSLPLPMRIRKTSPDSPKV